MSPTVTLLKVNYDIPDLKSISRIQDSKAQIDQLIQAGHKVVLCSHWGRPEGADPEYSLKNMLAVVEKTLGYSVMFVNQYKGFELASKTIQESNSQVFLLENTRFANDEKSKSVEDRTKLAAEYAKLAGEYIDEAFALSHRKEATNTEIKKLLPSKLGMSHQNEIEHSNLYKHTSLHPNILIMGGAKVQTKLPVIKNLIEKVDKVVIGGLLGLTFLQASNELGLSDIELYDSKIYPEFLPEAKKLLKKYSDKILLPEDLNYTKSNQQPIFAYDIGRKTVETFVRVVESAKVIFWNGTMGRYEDAKFKIGTDLLSQKLLEISKDCEIYVGGGDTVAALSESDLAKLKFVSMGGGATLDFLSK